MEFYNEKLLGNPPFQSLIQSLAYIYGKAYIPIQSLTRSFSLFSLFHISKCILIQTVHQLVSGHHTHLSALRLTHLSHQHHHVPLYRQYYGANNMSHMKRACDTYIPLLSRRSGSLPHCSRIIIVNEDGNFSEVSKLGECSGFNELYLVVTSVSIGD